MNVWGSRVRPVSPDRALAALLLKTGIMGRAERQLISKIVAPGHCVVDVGANQGVFTLLLSRLVGPEGRVLALEPDPAMFASLDENCLCNNARNVSRLQAAAGARRSQGMLRRSAFNRGDNRMLASQRGPSVPVEIVSLDDVLPTGNVDFIKIDVQGYELSVVTGMEAVLERSPRIRVFFEYWPAGLLAAGSVPSDLLEFFRSRGFSLLELSRAGLRPVADGGTARPASVAYWSWRNFLAVRESDVGCGLSTVNVS